MAERGERITEEAKLTEHSLRSLEVSGTPYPHFHGYEAGHQDGRLSQLGADCGTSSAHSLELLKSEYDDHACLRPPEDVNSFALGVVWGRAIAPVVGDLSHELAQFTQPNNADDPIGVTCFTDTGDPLTAECAIKNVEDAFATEPTLTTAVLPEVLPAATAKEKEVRGIDVEKAADVGPPARGTSSIGLTVAVLLAVAISAALLATGTMTSSIAACGAALFVAGALVAFKMIR